MKNLLTTIFSIYSFLGFCQDYTLSGIVRNSNQEPVEMVGVFTKTGQGTLTNELGEFTLKVSTLPAKIMLSHLSYKAVEVTVADQKLLPIVLEENVKTLPEAKVGNYAIELIYRVIDKVAADSTYNHFARGFYRKIQKEGEKYTVLHELLFNANTNGKYGIDAWQPTASRYTLHDGHVENRTIQSSIRSSSSSPRVQFITDNYGLIPKNEIAKMYRFDIENFIDQDTPNEIAVVLCTPKEPTETSFTGKFYVKTATNALLKVTGRRKLNKKFWTHNFWFKVKESYLDLNVSYRADGEVSVLSGMDLDFVTLVQYASVVNKTIIDHVDLIMYEYGEPKNNEARQLQNSIVPESEIFKTTQESPDFWANNAVIKRTPVEDEIIKVFESRKKKGSTLFINK
ncbi:MAG: hypothetical protein EAZ32_06620 [Cytophagia bacterium]|nr:MAG: hypothetical protein EAZ32_06620 [Cytophagia bacterium]TAG81995.1 MAG: hypothetical protein EAZ22_06200 [Cytophagales bacterium]